MNEPVVGGRASESLLWQAPPGRYIPDCDRDGAGVNTANIDPHGLCPRDGCLIDSRKPFRHVQTFHADGEDLVGIENRLEQGGSSFAFSGTFDRAYLASMSVALRQGMVLTFQLWGGPSETMWWLDAMTGCEDDCPTSSRVVYSDIRIRKG